MTRTYYVIRARTRSHSLLIRRGRAVARVLHLYGEPGGRDYRTKYQHTIGYNIIILIFTTCGKGLG